MLTVSLFDVVGLTPDEERVVCRAVRVTQRKITGGTGMWICGSDYFLSVVDDGQVDGCLVVRARRKGDIEKIFPDADVKTLRGRDYQFRAHIEQETVAQAIHNQVMNIDYDNFKNSVEDDKLHDAYAGFWQLHSKLQPIPPYKM